MRTTAAEMVAVRTTTAEMVATQATTAEMVAVRTASAEMTEAQATTAEIAVQATAAIEARAMAAIEARAMAAEVAVASKYVQMSSRADFRMVQPQEWKMSMEMCTVVWDRDQKLESQQIAAREQYTAQTASKLGYLIPNSPPALERLISTR